MTQQILSKNERDTNDKTIQELEILITKTRANYDKWTSHLRNAITRDEYTETKMRVEKLGMNLDDLRNKQNVLIQQTKIQLSKKSGSEYTEKELNELYSLIDSV